jgi:cytochrome oxidase assembly protein ShyY1
MGRYFSGRLIAINLFALAAVITCLWLGKWQWDRAHAIVQVELTDGQADFANLSPLRQYLPPSSVGVPTTVSGTWQPDGQLIFQNRPQNGSDLLIESDQSAELKIADQQVGIWVLDVLTLTDGSSLGVVHSWLADKQAVQQLSGEVTLTGVMQPSELALTKSLVELPAYITTENIVQKAKSTVHDGYFVSTKPLIGDQGVSPIFMQPQEVKLQWRNVIYTGNWVIFAIIISAMWWRIIQDELKQQVGKSER